MQLVLFMSYSFGVIFVYKCFRFLIIIYILFVFLNNNKLFKARLFNCTRKVQNGNDIS